VDNVKRIIVWIDSKDDVVEQVGKSLKNLLSSLELKYKIVDIGEIVEKESE
jgi:hypothetical protein